MTEKELEFKSGQARQRIAALKDTDIEARYLKLINESAHTRDAIEVVLSELDAHEKIEGTYPELRELVARLRATFNEREILDYLEEYGPSLTIKDKAA